MLMKYDHFTFSPAKKHVVMNKEDTTRARELINFF